MISNDVRALVNLLCMLALSNSYCSVSLAISISNKEKATMFSTP